MTPGRAILFSKPVAWAVVMAVALALPYVFTSGTALTKMCLIGITVLFALSYNMLLGQTGLLSFGHAVYLGLGGFVTIHLITAIGQARLPIPVTLMPLVGGIGGALFGILFGALSTKRHGTAFAMISLAVAELIAASSQILQGFFGGESGVSTDRSVGLPFFGFDLGPPIQVYYLIAVWVVVCAFLIHNLTGTPLGRMCNAVRDNPERAEFVGYSMRVVRFYSFVMSAFFAGVAGGLAAINYEIMTAVNLSPAASATVLIMVYIGGIGQFYGPVLGAILISLIQVSLSDLTPAWMLYLGLMFILMVLFAPQGIAGLIEQHSLPLRTGLLHRLLPSYLMSGAAGLVFALGCVVLLEMTYHRSRFAHENPVLRLFWTPLDTASLWTWIAASLGVVISFLIFRSTWPLVKKAWDEVDEAMKARLAQ